MVRLALLLAVCVRAQDAALPRALTLEAAFEASLRRSESLAIAAASADELEARVDELVAAVKPRVVLRASELVQDAPDAAGGSDFSSTVNRRYRPEAKVNARQTLFSGLREFLVLKAAKAQGRAAHRQLDRARSLLYADVAAAFLRVARERQELETSESLRKLSSERVGELSQRVRIGRSRRSEQLAAEAQLATIEARIELLRGAERVGQEALAFLTGLSAPVAPVVPPLPVSMELEPFLERARARADVDAARLSREAAVRLETSAGRERWPLVTADANYYLKRTGSQKDISWDVLLALELPLWTGGGIGARAEQASARLKAADAALSAAARRAELETRSAWRDLDSALSRVKVLERAVSLAEQNAEAQSEDYRKGLVTNLDVVGSLNTLFETRLQLDGARFEAALARAELETAAGGPNP